MVIAVASLLCMLILIHSQSGSEMVFVYYNSENLKCLLRLSHKLHLFPLLWTISEFDDWL